MGFLGAKHGLRRDVGFKTKFGLQREQKEQTVEGEKRRGEEEEEEEEEEKKRSQAERYGN